MNLRQIVARWQARYYYKTGRQAAAVAALYRAYGNRNPALLVMEMIRASGDDFDFDGIDKAARYTDAPIGELPTVGKSKT